VACAAQLLDSRDGLERTGLRAVVLRSLVAALAAVMLLWLIVGIAGGADVG